MPGLSITLFVSAVVVVVSALLLVGPAPLAESDAPLVTAPVNAGFGEWQWVVRIGSAFATLGVLLSLMTGISRMLFAIMLARILVYLVQRRRSCPKISARER